jgi:pilus assembly protein CpaE
MTKAVETIGREIYWQLPNDYATMVESRNNGIPLFTQAPKSKLTKSIQQLALSIDKAGHSADTPDEPKKGKSLFRFLSSGSSK